MAGKAGKRKIGFLSQIDLEAAEEHIARKKISQILSMGEAFGQHSEWGLLFHSKLPSLSYSRGSESRSY